MAFQYQYSARTELLQGGYPGEWRGPESSSAPWITTTLPSGTNTTLYWFADSNNADNYNSSQILITVTDRWTASVDSKNNVTIKLSTTIDKIERGKILGNPNLGGNYTRDITISRYKNGPVIFSALANPINVARVLATNLTVATETIVLEPGKDATRSSIYIYNHTTGFPNEEKYTDEFQAGVFFKNILPNDYRPGYTIANGKKLSHNRNSGAANIKSNASYITMRTQDGAVGSGNPPLIKHNSGWLNQRLIGDE